MEGVRPLLRLCWVPSPLDDLDDLEKIEGDISVVGLEGTEGRQQGEEESRNYSWIMNTFVCVKSVDRSIG